MKFDLDVILGQGQPEITIWTNLVGPKPPMLHTKTQGLLLSSSDIKRQRFILYMGLEVTTTIKTNFRWSGTIW